MNSTEITESIWTDPENIDLYFDRGVELLQERKYLEAISDFLFYQSAGGTEQRSYKYLAISMIKGSIKNGAQIMEKYCTMCPEDSEALLMVADSNYELCQYSQAAKYYKMAIEAGAVDSSILETKAKPLLDRKMYDEASYFVEVKRKGLFGRR